MNSNYEISTRDNGAVEVVVRPAGGRPFRLVGFVSETSAQDWVRARIAREDRHLPPVTVTQEPARFY